MYKALYRKWRPTTFDDVCGQKQITDILKYQIAENKTSHAYLFCGSRGTGKTSCAKIFAKAINCEHPINGNPCNECDACRSIDSGTATDVIEMDAASNTGVDNVRDIKDEIVFSPAILKYRVYIIDEVHMMSGSAFNALLKTLEEPPDHVVFILATTELHKLPSTIISRCQRYDFKRFTTSVIVERLMKISAAENIDLDPDGAKVIARMAFGGMRDAISLLELCAGLHKRIDFNLVCETLGSGNRAEISTLINAILVSDYSTVYKTVADICSNSRDISVFFGDIIGFYRDMMVVKTGIGAKDYLDLTDVEYNDLADTAAKFSMETLVYHSSVLEKAVADMNRPGLQKRAVAELALTRLCEPSLTSSYDALLARISSLEGEVSRLKLGISNVKMSEKSQEKMRKYKAEDMPNVLNDCEEKTDSSTSGDKTKDKSTASVSSEPLPFWSEVVEKTAKIKPSLAGCLANSSAVRTSDGKIIIGLKSAFFKAKTSAPDSLAIIADIISDISGTTISGSDISVSVGETAKSFDFEKELNG